MYRSINVDIDVTDVVEKLDSDDLKELGLIKLGEHRGPITEQIRQAALRVDVETFIELTRQMLDEKLDVFVRTDRLLANLRKINHVTA